VDGGGHSWSDLTRNYIAQYNNKETPNSRQAVFELQEHFLAIEKYNK